MKMLISMLVFAALVCFGQTVSGPNPFASLPRITTLVRTNFVDGFPYVNGYGSTIQVTASATLVAAVSTVGAAALHLEIPTSTTNQVSISTSATSLASTGTNMISGLVPAGASYTFTNKSNGAGNSGAVRGGQILIQ